MAAGALRENGAQSFSLYLPYAVGVVPGSWAKLSVLSMILIPLTWAYAIARYRLMDVDVIFAQGYVYTLATVAVLGIFYGLVFSVTKFGHIEELAPSAVMVLIIIATFVFQPIRNWLQENLDRYVFYKESYDYRRTLIEFARDGDGIGPVFNAKSCVACHFQGGVGGAGDAAQRGARSGA